VGLYLNGAKIAFASEGSKQLLNDLGVVRPTLFAGVPKVYERIRDAVKGKATGIGKKLLEAGLEAKAKDLETGCGYCWLYDAIVFKKVKAALGGRCRIMITGGAKISKDTLMFLRCALGPVVQGYGATETSAAATLTMAEDTVLGPVGAAMPHTQIKLVDVPDMNLLCGSEADYAGHPEELDIIKQGVRCMMYDV
jgi:long-chain acyl-CoA synthetase